MQTNLKNSSLPPWERTEVRRFLLCPQSMRAAAGLFAGTAGIVFAAALLFYLVAPAYAAAALHAVMDFYQARADWAYRYLSGMTVVLLNNTVAALLASSLGVVGAFLIAYFHAQSGEPAAPAATAGIAQRIIGGAMTGASLVFAPIAGIRNLPARVAISVAVLAPALSVITNGALVGIWLGSCLADDQLAGILKGLQSIAPHAVFELPAICAAAAVGLHIASHLLEVAQTQPQMIAPRAVQCLTSPALRRTWGLLFLLILAGAVLETRVSWGIQERLYASAMESF